MNRTNCIRRSRGFSLIELMVVVAVLAIISAIAVPAYTNYIQTSREGVLLNNIATIEVFQEDFRLRNGAYAVNLADVAAIEAAIDWAPQTNDGTTYSIANGDGTTYSVTATNPEGTSICMVFPAKTRC